MVFIDGIKYACDRCIRGHRVSSCKHTDQPLTMIKPKGRPTTQCSHCRENRKSKQLHTKCLCGHKQGPHSSSCPCYMDADLCTCTKKKTGLRRTASNPPVSASTPESLSSSTSTVTTVNTPASNNNNNNNISSEGPVRSASTTSLVSRKSSNLRGRTRSRNATISSTTSTASTTSTNSSVVTTSSPSVIDQQLPLQQHTLFDHNSTAPLSWNVKQTHQKHSEVPLTTAQAFFTDQPQPLPQYYSSSQQYDSYSEGNNTNSTEDYLQSQLFLNNNISSAVPITSSQHSMYFDDTLAKGHQMSTSESQFSIPESDYLSRSVSQKSLSEAGSIRDRVSGGNWENYYGFENQFSFQQQEMSDEGGGNNNTNIDDDPSAEVAAVAAQLLPPEVINMSLDYYNQHNNF